MGDSSCDVLLYKGGKALARKRQVSVRTLQRQLDRSGTGLRDFQEEERRRRALDLLASPLSFREVAAVLGLSAPEVLTRFVKRVFGRTPTQLRKDLHRREPADPA